jgi:hypothetical protein
MGAYALRLLANTGSLHIEPKLIPLVRVLRPLDEILFVNFMCYYCFMLLYYSIYLFI